MKRRDFLEKIFFSGLGLAGISTLNEGFISINRGSYKSDAIRKRENIDFDWRFNLGDVAGAEQPSYHDNNWRTLDLPHDWSIEGGYREDNPSNWRGGYLPGGIGWYRKTLKWQPDWKDRKVTVDFDGVYMNSDVWINGHHLGRRPNGFISFRYDLTPWLKEGENVIAVRVDNSKQPSSRWYTGSGIYRHVWLNVTSFIHVAHWGTFIATPDVNSGRASIKIKTTVENHSPNDEEIEIEQILKDHTGNVVAKGGTTTVLKKAADSEIKQNLAIGNPSLWSPERPYLYDAETVIKSGGSVVDRYHTPVGIRKLEFSAKWGFRINGQSTLIKGTCNHEDGGGAVGTAVPDDELYYRLRLLKDMGCNAVRTSHNPRSPQFYMFCDALGLMVMDEAFDGWDEPKAKYDYGLYFSKWWRKDLDSFICRDRNHPSVILWSIGNEVRGYTDERQKELVDFIHGMDPTRPVTQGRGYVGPYVDIAGFNGHGELKGTLEEYHKKHPEKPVVGTEMTHTLQTRGVYRTQTWYRKTFSPLTWFKGHMGKKQEGKVFPVLNLSEEEIFNGIPDRYLSSYDNALVRINVRDQFKHDSKFPFLMGSFRWTGFDYIGEAINHWPTRAGDYGIIDLAGFPKDHYYLYQSLWSDKPMVHILPHWTHPGKEGVRIPVVVYTNCEKVELFLNDTSLGEKEMGEDLQLVWQVPYKPGRLVAVAKNNNDLKLKESVTRTAGPPFAIKVTSGRTTMRANRRDVARVEVSVVDKHGVVVPEASNPVQFKIEGPGRLIGTDNGDIADLNPTKADHRKAFMGKCMVLIKATDKSGLITIEAMSNNLANGRCRVEAV